MIRRSKGWRVAAMAAAAIFSLANLLGVVWHVREGELLWAGAHAALAIVAAYLVRRLAPRGEGHGNWQSGAAGVGTAPEFTDRLSNLEQSVDAVAIEVERIGEGQRFVTRLFTESGAPPAPGERATAPLEGDAQEAAPHGRS
jgi:hypothetical protein